MNDDWDNISANHFSPFEDDMLCILTFSDEGRALQNASTIQHIEETPDEISTHPILKANAMIMGLDLDESNHLWAVDLKGNVFSNNRKLTHIANRPDKDPIYDCKPNWHYASIINGVPSCLKTYKGKVYIATFTGDIYEIDKDGTFTVAKGSMHPFRFKRLDSLYLNTNTALLRLEIDGTWSPLRLNDSNSASITITDVAEWKGINYAFCKAGQIYTIDKDVLTIVAQSPAPIYEVAKTPEGLALASGPAGIKLFDGTQVIDFRGGDYVGATTLKNKTLFHPASTKRPWVVCYDHATSQWSKWNL